MAYLVLGTLYNRYVLNLTGTAQIPQFSFEAMRYHTTEAWKWIRERMGNGRSGFGDADGGVNFVSHQAQAGLESAGGGGGGFVRPTSGAKRAPQPQRATTNPVSHQAQVPQPPPKDDVPDRRQQQRNKKTFDVERGAPASREEREFMLGADDDELEEREAEITLDDGSASSKIASDSPFQDESHDNDVAAVRGRGIGEDGVIRL